MAQTWLVLKPRLLEPESSAGRVRETHQFRTIFQSTGVQLKLKLAALNILLSTPTKEMQSIQILFLYMYIIKLTSN